MRRATTGGHPPPTAPGEAALISFDQLVLAYLQARVGAKSAVRDRNAAQHLFPVFTERLLSDIRPADIRQYLTARRAAGAAASTVNKEIGLLARAIHYANREWGYSLYNPVQGCKQREPEGRVRWLTHAQAASLVAAAGRLGPRAAHLPDLITLALHTGMRKGELLGLEWQRVDFENGLIYLEGQHTKSNKRRSIPINQPARAALTSRRAAGNGALVFGGVKDGVLPASLRDALWFS